MSTQTPMAAPIAPDVPLISVPQLLHCLGVFAITMASGIGTAAASQSLTWNTVLIVGCASLVAALGGPAVSQWGAARIR